MSRKFDEDEIVAMLEAEPERPEDREPPRFTLEVVEGAYGGAVDLVRVSHPGLTHDHSRRMKRAFDALMRSRNERFVFTRIVLDGAE